MSTAQAIVSAVMLSTYPILLSTYLVLAQHAPAPASERPEIKCKTECHAKHCDAFTQCFQLSEAEQPACMAQVNKVEDQCMERCGGSAALLLAP
jgi:hypothetical protein